MTLDPTCEAFLRRGTRCHFAAKHHHHIAGFTLYLCDVHLRTIQRREEREKNAAELATDWKLKRAEFN